MVFAYLVAPAIIALAAADSWLGRRIVLAWIVALLASALGLLASYRWDLLSPALLANPLRKRAGSHGLSAGPLAG